jgi:hypothetical protein
MLFREAHCSVRNEFYVTGLRSGQSVRQILINWSRVSFMALKIV